MKLLVKIFLSLLILSLDIIVIYSQTGITDYQTFIDSSITKNFIYTNYDNQSSSVNFYSKINYNLKKDNFNFYIKNYYNSAITRLQNKFFRDFDNVKTGIGYDVTDKLNLSANFLGILYSDKKNIQLKGSSSGFYYMSARYEDMLLNAPYFAFLDAGYKNENQIGEYNKGLSLRGEMNIDNLDMSKYFINANLKFGYEKLDPRSNNSVIGKLLIDKSFAGDLVSNSFDGYFSNIKKDFYLPADIITKNQYGVNNNIEKRTETIIRIFNRFDYTISDNAVFFLLINPYFKNIIKENFYIPQIETSSPGIYDTQISEASIFGDLGLNLSLNKLNFLLRLSYLERDEKHYLENPERISNIFVKEKQSFEATKNNNTSKITASGNIYYNLNDKNRFELIGLSSIQKYDTPSEENYYDRDELNYLAYIAHRYNNYKNLELRTSIDLNLYHTVYLFSQKSSNNNWNRVLRLSSYSYFKPSDKFRTINTFSVLANYTVYDFQDLLSEVESYTFRQFNIRDSIIYDFSNKFAFKMFSEIKLYERGELNWSGFSVRPESYIEDKLLIPELYYYHSDLLTFSGGYRVFEQKRYNFISGEKKFDSFIRSQGPIVKIQLNFGNYSLLEVIGSYDYYNYGENIPVTSNGNLYLNVLWNL